MSEESTPMTEKDTEKDTIVALVRARLKAAADNDKLAMKDIAKLRSFLGIAGKMIGQCAGSPAAKADAQLMVPGGMGTYDLDDYDGGVYGVSPGVTASMGTETFAATLLRELTAGAGGLTSMYRAQVAAKLAQTEIEARKSGNIEVADKLAELFKNVTDPKPELIPEVKDGKDRGDSSAVPSDVPVLPAS